MLLHDLVSASRAVAATSARLEKVDRLARLLRRLEGPEVTVAVSYLSGSLPQGKIGVGPATLDTVFPVESAREPRLELVEVHRALEGVSGIGGKGAVERRVAALRELMGRATEEGQDFLARLLLGELRQGAGEGLMAEAVAEAAGAEPAAVRRAVMLRGEVAAVARAALQEGPSALEEFTVRLFRPVQPMLAETADGVGDALDAFGPAALEYKLDGARVQAHVRDDRARVYSRRMNDVTTAVPEVVEALRGLRVGEAVLDGEVLALREDGSPRPFQETMRRFGRTEDVEEMRREIPLTPFFFDCLYLEGEPLLERPARRRFTALEETVDGELLIPRIVTSDPEEGERFFRAAVEAGHEGLVAKALEAPYSAGRRGRSWLKLKSTYTADLVILAAEWGHGRREGWLSNVHLGARTAEPRPEAAGSEAGREPYPPEWAMVGKTFKGMTDDMLAWQTERLLELERGREERTVYVRPEVVAEVEFDGVQASPQYAGGVALRFARVKGYRRDKAPGEADTLERLRQIAPAGPPTARPCRPGA